ncbi:hypothetical protein [Microbacterium gorillae]|uniref:hypothetical protein n=1 Tax=Microbacterium gorillae TaxID=1231063 RepID=UPI003D978B16
MSDATLVALATLIVTVLIWLIDHIISGRPRVRVGVSVGAAVALGSYFLGATPVLALILGIGAPLWWIAGTDKDDDTTVAEFWSAVIRFIIHGPDGD